MYLVEAKPAVEGEAEFASAGTPSARWELFPYSRLSHHGERCCELARQWVVAMDFAQLNGASPESGPRWLREKYKWGPSPWPMHWCEVVERDTIDCGAHAALANEVFRARGLTALPAQLVQRYSTEATTQWRGSWEAEEVSCHWLDGEHIYHEVTAVLSEKGELRIWDGSAASWSNPRQRGGYGSVVSIRVFAEEPPERSRVWRWGDERITPNLWHQIGA